MAIGTRLPALFVGHGSPMTAITDNPERRTLGALGRLLPRPAAILCITAHWETIGTSRLTSGPAPRTIHDFRGFPPELYAMEYPAPGSDALVRRVIELLGPEQAVPDDTWGFDHGTWGVLDLLFPGLRLPTVAMSLDMTLPPERHFALGQALAPLRDEGILVVGSGNIIHNLGLWRQGADAASAWAPAFQQEVNRAVTAGDRAALVGFPSADPVGALAINSAEHYLPLLYACGARLPGDEVQVFNDSVTGALSMTSYLIGTPVPLPAESLR